MNPCFQQGLDEALIALTPGELESGQFEGRLEVRIGGGMALMYAVDDGEGIAGREVADWMG